MATAGWFFTGPVTGFMFVVVSGDRLFAVVAPLKYFSVKVSFGHKMVAVPFTIAFLGFVWGVVGQATSTELNCDRFSCVQGCGQSIVFVAYFQGLYLLNAIISCLLYLLTAVLYVRNRAKVTDLGQNAAAQAARRQQKLIRTVGLTVFCTFLFIVLPIMAFIIATALGVRDPRLSISYDLMRINPLCNLLIYFSRQVQKNLATSTRSNWRGCD